MNKKRLGIIFFLLLLLIGIPLAVYLNQQRQDVRQRAAEFQYTEPSNYSQWPVCPFPDPRFVSVIPGIRGCVGESSIDGKGVAKIVNTSSVTHKVGIASYKAFQQYKEPVPYCSPSDCPDKWEFIWSQELYDSKDNITLNPGQTVYLTVNVPECAWQIDVFTGSTMPTFFPPDEWYAGQNRFIDGYFNTKLAMCTEVTNTPTPTPTTVITPSPSDTPTPTPTGIITPSPTDTPTPTPTVPACPVPSQVLNVRIKCPNCSSL